MLSLLFLLLHFTNSPAWAIYHGVEAPRHFYREVKVIELHKTRGVCTGVFVGPRVLLTAAHCLEKVTQVKWFKKHLNLTVDGVKPDGFRVHTLYSNTSEKKHLYDIAVIRFPVDFHYGKLSFADLQKGDRVELVGFGWGDPSASDARKPKGVKRFGVNRIHDRQWGQISLRAGEASKYEAMPTDGDSGGPLFDSQGGVVGIASRGLTVAHGKRNQIHYASYIDLQAPEIQKFLSKAFFQLKVEVSTDD